MAILLLGAGGLSCRRSPPVSSDAVTFQPVTASELRQVVTNAGGRAVLVNMWATWCVPCREEFPDLMRLHRQFQDRGLRLVLVSWDVSEEDARRFLAAQGVDFPSYHKAAAQGDTKFIEEFEPRWTGAFPATFIYDPQGQLRHSWEGRQNYAFFEEKTLDVLNH